ncbi:MAG: type II toxin-antitoxin system VapC family toxin [Devosia sp.]|uniref:type II toxin-antitoxin system VapC family toxin n=1 Tax=Devosia sp. TaxID=1871048 RepID=UPI001ACBB233|nr:type II toxin-antitoxin system VapC family toxin [Devosia sp.]MBN9317105.1 type II toxin-antitoxin system VapC family toxin [Devosia sp.]
MSFLLDTSAMIAFLRGHASVVRQARNVGPGSIAISSIVLHELYFGAYKGNRTDADLRVIGQLRFAIVEFDAADALRAGEIRALLQRQGTSIGPLDTLIAGQALARDLTLVTRNTREFERVDGLRVESWEA